MRDGILARRLQRRDACKREISRTADELAAIDELLHLVAHSVATAGSSPDSTAELERRLWELDEVDTAMQALRVESEAA